jgi:hypothetical protein
MAFAVVFQLILLGILYPEDGPATETSCPGVNLNGGEVAVQSCVYFITKFPIIVQIKATDMLLQ